MSPLTLRVGLGLLLCAVASSFAVARVTQSSVTQPGVQTIFIQNHSSFVSDAEVRNDIPAFQAALSDDFAPLWHIDGKLVWLPRGAKVPKGQPSITLIDKGPVKGALAYHELTDGVPDAIVYVGVSRFYGYLWSVGLTHELWELLADAPAGAGAVETTQDAAGTIWAREIADPCEADGQGYDRPGADGKPVRISDFITPRWFGAQTIGPYDYMEHIQKALEILPGGYAQFWDPFTGWNVVSNFRKGELGANGAFYD